MRSVATIFVLAVAWPASPAHAQETSTKFDPAVRPEFREPVTLASKDGVLEVQLIAKQGTAERAAQQLHLAAMGEHHQAAARR
jgi:hypothetical protein